MSRDFPSRSCKSILTRTEAALFSDAMKRDRVAVQTVLSEYRDFIDRWLDASEEKRPRHITEEERTLRAKLRRVVRDLRKTKRFDADFFRIVIESVAKSIGDQSSTLTAIQIAESVEDAVTL